MNVSPKIITLPFQYDFGRVTDPLVTLEETARATPTTGGPSTSGIFWLNSGGETYSSLGRGHSMQGDILSGKAHDRYKTNADTEFGLHPQSLFRLYTRQTFLNTSCSVIYRMNQYYLTDRETRQASNGLLIMSRATPDGQNSYYGGVRVDGYAVIKRKKNGEYSDNLLPKRLYPGTYSREATGDSGISSPNLLPLGRWIGIKLTTQTLSNNTVKLTLWRDPEWTGIWSKIGEVIDTDPILPAGLHALRTDYCDQTYDAFRIEAA